MNLTSDLSSACFRGVGVRWAAATCMAFALPPLASATDFRGFASPGPLGVTLFQECRGKAPGRSLVKIDDATPDGVLSAGLDEVRKIMLEPGRPIYMEFRGGLAAGQIKATQFVRAVGTVESCAATLADLPAGTRLWAGGLEPAWQLVVGPREARLERPGMKPVRFPAAPFVAPAGPAVSRTIDAWSSLDGGTVRMETTVQMCSDGSSETAYGVRATLRYGSTTYEGCAAQF